MVEPFSMLYWPFAQGNGSQTAKAIDTLNHIKINGLDDLGCETIPKRTLLLISEAEGEKALKELQETAEKLQNHRVTCFIVRCGPTY